MYFLLVQKVPKIHKLSFPKESLIKEKFQLHVVQKLRLFPIKSTSLTDKKANCFG